MKFDWDENKNQINIKRHGFDFSDAHKVFDHPMLANLDTCEDYGEDRWIGIGLFDFGVNFSIVWKVAKEELPEIKKQIEKIIKTEKQNG